MSPPGSGHAVGEGARSVLDGDLRPGERPRVVRVPGGSPGAEALLRSASRAELRELFEGAHPIA